MASIKQEAMKAEMEAREAAAKATRNAKSARDTKSIHDAKSTRGIDLASRQFLDDLRLEQSELH